MALIIPYQELSPEALLVLYLLAFLILLTFVVVRL